MRPYEKFGEFNSWIIEFSNSSDGNLALKKLKKKFGKGSYSNNFKHLQLLILKNCFLAQIYKEEKDPNANLRKLYEGSFSKDLESVIKSVVKVRNFVTQYPEVSSWAMLPAYNKLKDNEFKIESHNIDKIPFAEFLNILLEGLSEGLSKPIPGVKAGPWLHRWAIGALLYPEDLPLDQQPQRPKNVALSSLAFILVSIFREHTNNWEGKWRDRGRPMPKYGAPSIGLVTDFVNATLNLNKTGDDLKNMVRKMEKLNVTINIWPHEKGKF